MKTTDFKTATPQYENWLRIQTTVIEGDLRHKYRKMREEGVFTFFRGTFYRWAELWEAARKELGRKGVLVAKAPKVLCVGDLHLENFGTWRDAEGRLVWGINDFDEAHSLRYLNDLVRLATSVFFAIKAARTTWKLSHETACISILGGYRESVASGGRPFVLARSIPWLWTIATAASRTPEQFLEKIQKQTSKPDEKDLRKVTRQAAKVLKDCAPEHLNLGPGKLRLRQAGVGSLGRPRFVQFFTGRDGQALREAKPVVPSAAVFAGLGPPIKRRYQKLLRDSVRIPDPFFVVMDGWTVRRLAYDSDKIALESLTSVDDAKSFFHAMGAETANIHLGSERRQTLEKHLASQCRESPNWLYQASKLMAKATKRDFEEFCSTNLGLR